MAPRNDIAIYSPFAWVFYAAPATSDGGARRGGGGAELQTTILARELARRGLRVAHIVYPVGTPAGTRTPSLEIVERLAYARRRGLVGRAQEALGVWRALSRADARAYVFRTGLSGGIAAFVIGALFCLLRRRRLVLSASNDLDFVFARDDRSRLTEAVYRWALKRTRCVVVQTEQQLELARAALNGRTRVILIRSFAELPAGVVARRDPEALLWVSRIVDYKLPLRFIELARALPEAQFRMIASETGETPPQLAAAVSEGAKDLPNLELLSPRPRAEVLELVASAAAVVLTSRYEGMPNVFLEAWGMGIPVISLHFDPDGRIAEKGLGICAGGSWERFVEASRELWQDARLRREIGERARRYVATTHAPDAVGEQWATAVRDVLS